jgi:hypothetical protein
LRTTRPSDYQTDVLSSKPKTPKQLLAKWTAHCG